MTMRSRSRELPRRGEIARERGRIFTSEDGNGPGDEIEGTER